jgi:quercetin dioxygenase-like cupin family protein
MKIFGFLFVASLPFLVSAQSTDYTISSFLTQGPKAPNTHYIGEAWLNSVIQADAEINYNITKATFRANSTLDWHKHSTPQVLIVVEGVGFYQERGKEAVIIKKGDVIRCNKDIEHWHTSSKENAVTYLAIYGGAQPTTWTEKLTQEYYDGVAEKLKAQKK